MNKFEPGCEIVKRTSLKEVAEKLGPRGLVYHETMDIPIKHYAELKRTPIYNENVDEITFSLNANCFAVEINSELFRLFDISVHCYRTSSTHTFNLKQRNISLQNKSCASKFSNSFISYEDTLYPISEQNDKVAFYVPQSWHYTLKNKTKKADIDITKSYSKTHQIYYIVSKFNRQIVSKSIQHCELFFKLKSNMQKELKRKGTQDIELTCYNKIKTRELLFSLRKNAPPVYIKKIFAFVGIYVSYVAGEFICHKKKTCNRLQEIKKSIGNKCPPSENRLDKVLDLIYDELVEFFYALKVKKNKSKNRLSKVQLKYIPSTYVLSTINIIQLLDLSYHLLFLLYSELGMCDASVLTAMNNSIDIRKITAQITCTDKFDRLALEAEPTDFKCNMCITDRLRIQGYLKSLISEDEMSKVQKLEQEKQDKIIYFLWENRAKFSEKKSDLQNGENYLEHGKEFFEFDEDLFVGLYYPYDAKKGKEEYCKKLISYRYVKEAVASVDFFSLKTECDVRTALKMIYQEVLKNISKGTAEYEFISIYLKKLDSKSHSHAFDEVIGDNDVPHEQKGSRVKKILANLEKYAQKHTIPYLNVNDTRKAVSEAELQNIILTIKDYIKEKLY